MTDRANASFADEFTEDGFLGGQLRLRQLKSGHRAGHDAVLLAASTPARSGDRVADFGAGVGAAGLSVARRVAGIKLLLVEIAPQLAELARANASANGIAAETIVLDVTGGADTFAAAGLAPDSIDVVLMNPPFAARGEGIGPCRDRNDTGGLGWRGAADTEIRRGAQPDLARRWIGRGADGTRSRFRQPRDPAGARRGGLARDSRAGARHQGRQGRAANLSGADAQ
jgi:hypothetical protein